MLMTLSERIAVVLTLALFLCTSARAVAPATGTRILVKASGDAGPGINAANEHLGPACGTIVVMSGAAALVQTPVHLSACHNLEIDSPLTWAERLILSGKN